MSRQLYARVEPSHVEVLDQDGSLLGVIELSPRAETWKIRVSPDGTSALVLIDVLADPRKSQHGRSLVSKGLYRVDFRAGQIRPVLTKSPTGVRDGVGSWVADFLWLDDAQILVQESRQVLVMDADGSNRRVVGRLPRMVTAAQQLQRSPGGGLVSMLTPRGSGDVVHLLDLDSFTIARTGAVGHCVTWLDDTHVAFLTPAGVVRVYDLTSQTHRPVHNIRKVLKALGLHGLPWKDDGSANARIHSGDLFRRDDRLWFPVKLTHPRSHGAYRFETLAVSSAFDGSDVRVEHSVDELVWIHRFGEHGWRMDRYIQGPDAVPVAWSPETPEFAKEPRVIALRDH